MTILWLSHLIPYPPAGGAPQRSFHLLRQAASRHRVHLVALNQRARLATPEAIRTAVHALQDICEDVDVFPMPRDRTPLHRVGLAAASFPHHAPYETNWLYNRDVHTYLRALATDRTFDLVHVDTLGLMPYAEIMGGQGAAVVLNHHDVQSHLFQRRADNERSVLRRCYLRREVSKLRREERRVCPRVDLNIAVSRLDAERLQEIAGPIPTAVVENGVDVDYFHPVESDTRRELVFAGSLGTYPNRDAVTFLLSEIWPALQAAAPDYRVTVVGPDPTPTMLAAARDPRVAVTGVVPDVRPYMARAAVYVCPMRVGGGTRLKVLDALAMEKPLVATALAVEGLDLIEERHYLRAETAAEFVAQIRRLEGDAQLRRALGRAGRALARRYSWDVIGERLRRAYAGASRGRGLTRARPMASDSRI